MTLLRVYGVIRAHKWLELELRVTAILIYLPIYNVYEMLGKVVHDNMYVHVFLAQSSCRCLQTRCTDNHDNGYQVCLECSMQGKHVYSATDSGQAGFLIATVKLLLLTGILIWRGWNTLYTCNSMYKSIALLNWSLVVGSSS